jgi:hypothetical protein
MASENQVDIETLAEKFNNLGLFNSLALKGDSKQPKWIKSCSQDYSLVASVSENHTEEYKEAAQDIATTLRVLGIVTDKLPIEEFEPYGPMWGMQAYASRILIPLSLINVDSLNAIENGIQQAKKSSPVPYRGYNG